MTREEEGVVDGGVRRGFENGGASRGGYACKGRKSREGDKGERYGEGGMGRGWEERITMKDKEGERGRKHNRSERDEVG